MHAWIRSYIFISIARFARRGDLSYSVPLPLCFIVLIYCQNCLWRKTTRDDVSTRLPCMEHPLFDIGYVFIIRIFLNNENNEIMFKRKVDYCFVLNLNFIHSSLEFDNYKRKEQNRVKKNKKQRGWNLCFDLLTASLDLISFLYKCEHLERYNITLYSIV